MSVESPSGDGPRSRLRLIKNTPKKDLAAELTLEGQTPSAVSRQTVSTLLPEIAAGAITAIEQLSIFPPHAIRQALSTAQLSDEQECYVASVVSSLRSRAGPEQQHEAARFVRSLGSGKSTLGIRTDIRHVSAVAQLVDVDEPVVIHFGEEFKQTRADQRRDICQLVSYPPIS